MDVRNTTNIGKVKIIMLKGEAGNSIESIEKTQVTATHEIYTITFTDGTTQQIAIAKGIGIVDIEKTSTVGLVDTYTISLTDGTTKTFEVINGQSYTIPQNGVIYYIGNDTPEGFEDTAPPSGQGAQIDDSTPTLSTVYSSVKTEQLIGKTITGTLPAGQTSITLSDASITTNSTIDYYTDVFGVNPTNIVVATGSVTLTFNTQNTNLGVKVRVS